MLRLKRHPSDTVAITWKERTGPSKRLVGKGIAVSVLIHVLMAILFQIRTQYCDTSGTAPAPTVFLDTEESSISILTDMRTYEEDPCQKFAREMHLDKTVHVSNAFSLDSQYGDLFFSTTPEKQREFLPVLTLPWSFSDSFAPSHHIYRVYPLKVTLHEDLRSLLFCDDGARLFRKADVDTMFSTPAFAESQPEVEFKISVATATGKITSAVCLRELLDKRLQGIAQHLVKYFRFSPLKDAKQKAIKGVVTIQFAGTFDTISSLLETEQQQ